MLLRSDWLALKILNLECAAHQSQTVVTHQRAELILGQLWHPASEKRIEGIQRNLISVTGTLSSQLSPHFRHVHHILTRAALSLFTFFDRAIDFVVLK